MTEKSYFWDGIAAGDAVLAPYNAEEFNNWMFLSFLSNNIEDGYVVPGYLGNLWVRSVGIGSRAVEVRSGAACFNNFLYILDSSKTIPISAPSVGFYRKDIITLRLYLNTNQIRLTVVEGTEAASLYVATEPTLTQTASIYEVALATVYIDGTSYLIDSYVHDKRKFIFNIFTSHAFSGECSNLIRNSEWLAFSGDGGIGDYIPEEWIIVSGFAGLYSIRESVTTGSGRNDLIVEPFQGGGTLAQWITAHGNNFTLKTTLETSGGSYGDANIFDCTIVIRGYRKSGIESAVSIQHRELQSGLVAGTQKEITLTIHFPENDIERLYIEIYAADQFPSQVILMHGFHAGNFRPIPEILMFKQGVTDAAWTATAKSTVTTTINFANDFDTAINDIIHNYTKAVVLRLRGRDSGSAASVACYMYAQGYAAPFNALYGLLRLDGVPNDIWRETTAIVPIDQIYSGTGAAGAQLRLHVNATGVATFDATVEVVGIII